MDKSQKIIFAGYAAVLGTPLVIHACSTLKARLFDRKIDEKTRRENLRITKAHQIVQDKIIAGHYQDGSYTDIQNDFEFYRITAEVE